MPSSSISPPTLVAGKAAGGGIGTLEADGGDMDAPAYGLLGASHQQYHATSAASPSPQRPGTSEARTVPTASGLGAFISFRNNNNTNANRNGRLAPSDALDITTPTSPQEAGGMGNRHKSGAGLLGASTRNGASVVGADGNAASTRSHQNGAGMGSSSLFPEGVMLFSSFSLLAREYLAVGYYNGAAYVAQREMDILAWAAALILGGNPSKACAIIEASILVSLAKEYQRTRRSIVTRQPIKIDFTEVYRAITEPSNPSHQEYLAAIPTPSSEEEFAPIEAAIGAIVSKDEVHMWYLTAVLLQSDYRIPTNMYLRMYFGLHSGGLAGVAGGGSAAANSNHINGKSVNGNAARDAAGKRGTLKLNTGGNQSDTATSGGEQSPGPRRQQQRGVGYAHQYRPFTRLEAEDVLISQCGEMEILVIQTYVSFVLRRYRSAVESSSVIIERCADDFGMRFIRCICSLFVSDRRTAIEDCTAMTRSQSRFVCSVGLSLATYALPNHNALEALKEVQLSSHEEVYVYCIGEWAHGLTLAQQGQFESARTVVATPISLLPKCRLLTWLLEVQFYANIALKDRRALLAAPLAPLRELHLTLLQCFGGGFDNSSFQRIEVNSAVGRLLNPPSPLSQYVDARVSVAYYFFKARSMYSFGLLKDAWGATIAAVAAAEELLGTLEYCLSDCAPHRVLLFGINVGLAFADQLAADSEALNEVIYSTSDGNERTAAKKRRQEDDALTEEVLKLCRIWAKKIRYYYPRMIGGYCAVAQVSIAAQDPSSVERAGTISDTFPQSILAQNLMPYALFARHLIPDAIAMARRALHRFPHVQEVRSMYRAISDQQGSYSHAYRSIVPVTYAYGDTRPFRVRTFVMFVLVWFHLLLIAFIVVLGEFTDVFNVELETTRLADTPFRDAYIPAAVGGVWLLFTLVGMALSRSLISFAFKDLHLRDTSVQRFLFGMRGIGYVNMATCGYMWERGRLRGLSDVWGGFPLIIFIALTVLSWPLSTRVFFVRSLDEPRAGFSSWLTMLFLDVITFIFMIPLHILLVVLEPLSFILFFLFMPSLDKEVSGNVKERLVEQIVHPKKRWLVGSGSYFYHLVLLRVLYMDTHSDLKTTFLLKQQEEEDDYRAFPTIFVLEPIPKESLAPPAERRREAEAKWRQAMGLAAAVDEANGGGDVGSDAAVTAMGAVITVEPSSPLKSGRTDVSGGVAVPSTPLYSPSSPSNDKGNNGEGSTMDPHIVPSSPAGERRGGSQNVLPSAPSSGDLAFVKRSAVQQSLGGGPPPNPPMMNTLSSLFPSKRRQRERLEKEVASDVETNRPLTGAALSASSPSPSSPKRPAAMLNATSAFISKGFHPQAFFGDYHDTDSDEDEERFDAGGVAGSRPPTRGGIGTDILLGPASVIANNNKSSSSPSSPPPHNTSNSQTNRGVTMGDVFALRNNDHGDDAIYFMGGLRQRLVENAGATVAPTLGVASPLEAPSAHHPNNRSSVGVSNQNRLGGGGLGIHHQGAMGGEGARGGSSANDLSYNRHPSSSNGVAQPRTTSGGGGGGSRPGTNASLRADRLNRERQRLSTDVKTKLNATFGLMETTDESDDDGGNSASLSATGRGGTGQHHHHSSGRMGGGRRSSRPGTEGGNSDQNNANHNNSSNNSKPPRSERSLRDRGQSASRRGPAAGGSPSAKSSGRLHSPDYGGGGSDRQRRRRDAANSPSDGGNSSKSSKLSGRSGRARPTSSGRTHAAKASDGGKPSTRRRESATSDGNNNFNNTGGSSFLANRPEDGPKTTHHNNNINASTPRSKSRDGGDERERGRSSSRGHHHHRSGGANHSSEGGRAESVASRKAPSDRSKRSGRSRTAGGHGDRRVSSSNNGLSPSERPLNSTSGGGVGSSATPDSPSGHHGDTVSPSRNRGASAGRVPNASAAPSRNAISAPPGALGALAGLTPTHPRDNINNFDADSDSDQPHTDATATAAAAAKERSVDLLKKEMVAINGNIKIKGIIEEYLKETGIELMTKEQTQKLHHGAKIKFVEMVRRIGYRVSVSTIDLQRQLMGIFEGIMRGGDGLAGNPEMLDCLLNTIVTLGTSAAIVNTDKHLLCAEQGWSRYLDVILRSPLMQPYIDVLMLEQLLARALAHQSHVWRVGMFNCIIRACSDEVSLCRTAAEELQPLWQSAFEQVIASGNAPINYGAMSPEEVERRVSLITFVATHPFIHLDMFGQEAKDKQTIFSRACREGDLALVTLLLKARAEGSPSDSSSAPSAGRGDINRVQSDGTNALQQAAARNHAPIVQHLLAQPGIGPSLSHVYPGKGTVLQIAVNLRRDEAIQAALKAKIAELERGGEGGKGAASSARPSLTPPAAPIASVGGSSPTPAANNSGAVSRTTSKLTSQQQQRPSATPSASGPSEQATPRPLSNPEGGNKSLPPQQSSTVLSPQVQEAIEARKQKVVDGTSTMRVQLAGFKPAYERLQQLESAGIEIGGGVVVRTTSGRPSAATASSIDAFKELSDAKRVLAVTKAGVVSRLGKLGADVRLAADDVKTSVIKLIGQLLKESDELEGNVPLLVALFKHLLFCWDIRQLAVTEGWLVAAAEKGNVQYFNVMMGQKGMAQVLAKYAEGAAGGAGTGRPATAATASTDGGTIAIIEAAAKSLCTPLNRLDTLRARLLEDEGSGTGGGQHSREASRPATSGSAGPRRSLSRVPSNLSAAAGHEGGGGLTRTSSMLHVAMSQRPIRLMMLILTQYRDVLQYRRHVKDGRLVAAWQRVAHAVFSPSSMGVLARVPLSSLSAEDPNANTTPATGAKLKGFGFNPPADTAAGGAFSPPDLCQCLMSEAKRRQIIINLGTAEDPVTHHTILSRACCEGDAALVAYLVSVGLEVLYLGMQLQRRAAMAQQQRPSQRTIPSPFDYVTSEGVTLLSAAIVGAGGDADGGGMGSGPANSTDTRSEEAIVATVAALLEGSKAVQKLTVPAPPPTGAAAAAAPSGAPATVEVTIGPLGMDVDLSVPKYSCQTALQLSEGLELEGVSRLLAVA